MTNTYLIYKDPKAEKKNGYEYRWTTPDGRRHSTFAPTLDNIPKWQKNGLKEIFHYCRHKLRLLQTKRFGGSAAKDTSGLRLSLRAHPEVNVLIVAESNF